MARPVGAQALRAIPKPCRRAVFPRRQLSPLPKIGEGFGEWSEAPSYEEGVGVDGGPEGLPSERGCRGTLQKIKMFNKILLL